MKPDWDLIESQLALYASKDGLRGAKAKQEIREALRDIKDEFRRTGKLPDGWEEYVK